MMKRTFLCALLVPLLSCDQFKQEVTDRFEQPTPSTWTSRSDCEAVLAQTPRSNTPRIGTWNIKYFPDAQEATATNEEEATDVPWLACAIATLDVDILAVQEFKQTDRAKQKQQELVARLNELTGGDWRLALATCAPAEVQHPGFLYDASRVTGTLFREIPALSPDPMCSNEVSPGFGGYFEIAGGPDFHLIAVHFQTGYAQTSMERRNYSLSKMQEVVEDAHALVPDADIVFAGDFNTGGCEDCTPPISSAQEVDGLAQTMFSMTEPLMLVAATETCSRIDNDRTYLLIDHFVISQSSQELAQGTMAHVAGICEETSCDRLREWHEDAYERLSDHCPVLLDLAAQDLD